MMCTDLYHEGYQNFIVDPGVRVAYQPHIAQALYTPHVWLSPCMLPFSRVTVLHTLSDLFTANSCILSLLNTAQERRRLVIFASSAHQDASEYQRVQATSAMQVPLKPTSFGGILKAPAIEPDFIPRRFVRECCLKDMDSDAVHFSNCTREASYGQTFYRSAPRHNMSASSCLRRKIWMYAQGLPAFTPPL